MRNAMYHLGRQLGVVAAVLVALQAAAAPDAAIRNAEALLDAGQIDAALTALRDLQVDHPDSVEVLLGIGCAEFAAGERAHREGNTGVAAEAFGNARASFEQVLELGAGDVREAAAYNRANSVAQVAKLMPDAEQYAAKVAALEEAARSYAQVLRQNPKHAGAQQNLDHVRFLLKKLLQNPPEEEEPPPQEQQEQQQSPQTVVQLFTYADTEIPRAQVETVPGQPIVELIPPPNSAGGSAP